EACRAGDAYDWRDELVAGVLPFGEPGEASPLPPEMVFYQPTPARHVFDLLDRLALDADDVLVDLGSGLGHVPLLTAICTPARGIGIEIEPVYVAPARKRCNWRMRNSCKAMRVQRILPSAACSTSTRRSPARSCAACWMRCGT